MKRIIITFIVGLLIFTSANAKEYTDYRYVGYEWQKKNDTEFCKYKETTINRFYKFVRVDEEYLEKGKSNKIIDETDFIEKDVWEVQNINANESKYVTNVHSKLTIDEIDIETNDYDYDINIYYKNTLIKKGDARNITLDKEYDISDITIELTTIKKITEIPINIVLKKSNKVLLKEEYIFYNTMNNKIVFAEEDNYKKILESMNFDTTSSKSLFFKNKKFFYKYYNLEKKYFKDLEKDELEGYEFDPNESYTIYKKYVRDEIKKEKVSDLQSQKYEVKPPFKVNTNKKDTSTIYKKLLSLLAVCVSITFVTLHVKLLKRKKENVESI